MEPNPSRIKLIKFQNKQNTNNTLKILGIYYKKKNNIHNYISIIMFLKHYYAMNTFFIRKSTIICKINLEQINIK